MPKVKKVAAENGAAGAPDTRSKERKVIDRARGTLDRIALVMRPAIAALEPSANLLDSNPRGLTEDDKRQLINTVKDARRLMLFVPTTVAMIEYLSSVDVESLTENEPQTAA